MKFFRQKFGDIILLSYLCSVKILRAVLRSPRKRLFLYQPINSSTPIDIGLHRVGQRITPPKVSLEGTLTTRSAVFLMSKFFELWNQEQFKTHQPIWKAKSLLISVM